MNNTHGDTGSRGARGEKNTHKTSRGRFNKEVQPSMSLNLNSVLTYSEFSVTEQLNEVSLLIFK